MSFYSNGEAEGDVALLAEGVDRNDQQTENHVREANVALLAEGVDRNPHEVPQGCLHVVALLAEGVDRNLMAKGILLFL